MGYILDAVLIVYFLLILVSVLGKNKNEDYLSVEYTTNMRGIAAIGIILHHMSERVSGGTIFGVMTMAGYLLVSFFFFLSGYGLLIQYKKKKEKYLDGFIKKRLLYIVVIYLLDVALYAVVRNLTGEHFTLVEVLKSIIFSGVARNSWYLIVLIALYVSFYFVFKSEKIKSIPNKIICIFAIETVFVICCIIFKVPVMWYLSNYGFVLGMLLAYYKDKIDTVLKSRYWIVLISVAVLFVFFYAVPVVTDRYLDANSASIIRILFRLISPLFSVALVIILSYKFKPSLFIWKWLGGISLEIYLIHGLVYSVLRSDVMWIENEAIWVLLTIVISIALAYPISLMNKQIAKLLKK